MKKYIYIISIIGVISLVLYSGILLYEKSHAQKTIIVVSMTPEEMVFALKNGTISALFHGTTPFKGCN